MPNDLPMNILTARVLQYRYDDGREIEPTLTIFEPQKTNRDDWECFFQFAPPPNQRKIRAGGIDSIQAIVCCLQVARAYIEHPEDRERARFQGMSHLGLPGVAERPVDYRSEAVPPPAENPGDLEVLADRRLGIPGGDGGVCGLTFTLFRPRADETGQWSCAFAFGPAEHQEIRLGKGADFVEAFLNALASARVVYEGMVPRDWEVDASEGWMGCEDFPFRVGRMYGLDRGR